MSADLAWWRALTLAERVAAVRAHAGDAAVDAERAERRLRRWLEQKSFRGKGSFARRLEAEDVREAELLRLLGEPLEALAARHPILPPWGGRVREALAGPDLPPPTVLEDSAQGQSLAGFAALAGPLMAQARARLLAEAERLAREPSGAPFEPERMVALCAASLPGRLQGVLSRTLLLELNVARLQGHLEGETGEERYRSFVQRLCQREVAEALLREYPVLARQLTLTVSGWEEAHLELLRRLCEDQEALRRAFSPEGAMGGVEALE
ncbi:type 2 lantipeptide synthetase LanM, partial [Corallococcus exercitus]